MKPFDPHAPVRIHEMHLPQWRQDGVTYFVTSRLADSMPREKLEQWRDERDTWLRARGLRTAEELDKLSAKDHNDFHRHFTASGIGGSMRVTGRVFCVRQRFGRLSSRLCCNITVNATTSMRGW